MNEKQARSKIIANVFVPVFILACLLLALSGLSYPEDRGFALFLSIVTFFALDQGSPPFREGWIFAFWRRSYRQKCFSSWCKEQS